VDKKEAVREVARAPLLLGKRLEPLYFAIGTMVEPHVMRR